jgi:hypothetical protein
MNLPRYARRAAQWLLGWANKHDPDTVVVCFVQPSQSQLVDEARQLSIIQAEDRRRHPSNAGCVLSTTERSESERLLRRVFGEGE